MNQFLYDSSRLIGLLMTIPGTARRLEHIEAYGIKVNGEFDSTAHYAVVDPNIQQCVAALSGERIIGVALPPFRIFEIRPFLDPESNVIDFDHSRQP